MPATVYACNPERVGKSHSVDETKPGNGRNRPNSYDRDLFKQG